MTLGHFAIDELRPVPCRHDGVGLLSSTGLDTLAERQRVHILLVSVS